MFSFYILKETKSLLSTAFTLQYSQRYHHFNLLINMNKPDYLKCTFHNEVKKSPTPYLTQLILLCDCFSTCTEYFSDKKYKTEVIITLLF